MLRRGTILRGGSGTVPPLKLLRGGDSPILPLVSAHISYVYECGGCSAPLFALLPITKYLLKVHANTVKLFRLEKDIVLAGITVLF